jgi:PAT family beta-lactamase induction signal transducer AmpG
MPENKSKKKNPWLWVPSLYYAEGIPYILVMSVSVIMYKRLGISNTDIALYTSWLYLPWVIKPFWSPIVDIFKTKRSWIYTMQLLIGAGLGGVALTIPLPNFFQYTLLFFWLLAFSSATHDISADGFYMMGLSDHDQAFFVGIRSTFYRLAMITGQGLLVILAGFLEKIMKVNIAWSITFGVMAGLFVLFFLYHKFILPKPPEDVTAGKEKRENLFKDFINTFVLFFKKKRIGIIIAFLLLYRLGEAQLVKMAPPFLLDSTSTGGLHLSTEEVGFIYGTIGVAALVIGGILGGYLASRNGLKHWIWWMITAINLPNLVYVLLSFTQPKSDLIIGGLIAVEQFGYGFGFTAYMLYMIYVSVGEFRTSHFAIATGFMALGMMLPGMVSGWLQELLGYQYFFIWIVIATIPAFIVTRFIDLDPDFGKKKKEELNSA